VPADLEKLAYDSALRALDKQERLVEELRARAGVVLAASSLAVSFLGGRGSGGPGAVVLGAAALDRFWERNEAVVYRLARSLSIAVAALGIEVLALAALLGATII
jgi:hypothetical protein